MAPTGERNDRLTSSTADDDENEGENLWYLIAISFKTVTMLPHSKYPSILHFCFENFCHSIPIIQHNLSRKSTHAHAPDICQLTSLHSV